MLRYEGADVLAHGHVVMARIMRGLAMIAEILSRRCETLVTIFICARVQMESKLTMAYIDLPRSRARALQ